MSEPTVASGPFDPPGIPWQRVSPRLTTARLVSAALTLVVPLVAGIVLGWNFGDGHLHDERLLGAIQAQCGFEPGELVCVFVESQPVFGEGLAWRIVDAAAGPRASGTITVDELCALHPWGGARGAAAGAGNLDPAAP